jgi:hypothetical protein
MGNGAGTLVLTVWKNKHGEVREFNTELLAFVPHGFSQIGTRTIQLDQIPEPLKKGEWWTFESGYVGGVYDPHIGCESKKTFSNKTIHSRSLESHEFVVTKELLMGCYKSRPEMCGIEQFANMVEEASNGYDTERPE